MEKYIDILHKSGFFVSVCKDEIKKILPCLEAYERYYKEGENIELGDTQPGIVVCGNVCIKAYDNSVLRTLSAGDMLIKKALPQSVYASAVTDCTILFVNTYKLLTVCDKRCTYHQTVIKNLFNIAARETAVVTERLVHISKSGTKEKLMSYMLSKAGECNSNIFELNCTRKQLAEYLNINRSAMTTELFKLQKEGIIKIDRNRIEILE